MLSETNMTKPFDTVSNVLTGRNSSFATWSQQAL